MSFVVNVGWSWFMAEWASRGFDDATPLTSVMSSAEWPGEPLKLAVTVQEPVELATAYQSELVAFRTVLDTASTCVKLPEQEEVTFVVPAPWAITITAIMSPLVTLLENVAESELALNPRPVVPWTNAGLVEPAPPEIVSVPFT